MATLPENENCLHGMRCPQCGSLEPFRIAVSVMRLVSDDGTDDDPTGHHEEWDDASYCECWACHKAGTVRDFRQDPPP